MRRSLDCGITSDFLLPLSLLIILLVSQFFCEWFYGRRSGYSYLALVLKSRHITWRWISHVSSSCYLSFWAAEIAIAHPPTPYSVHIYRYFSYLNVCVGRLNQQLPELLLHPHGVPPRRECWLNGLFGQFVLNYMRDYVLTQLLREDIDAPILYTDHTSVIKLEVAQAYQWLYHYSLLFSNQSCIIYKRCDIDHINTKSLLTTFRPYFRLAFH